MTTAKQPMIFSALPTVTVLTVRCYSRSRAFFNFSSSSIMEF